MMRKLVIGIFTALLLSFSWGMPLEIFTGIAAYATEQDATLTPADHAGDAIPVSFLKGRVTSQTGRYILGPGDELSILVTDIPEFDQKAVIRPDGYVSIKPFGEYYVAGIDVQGLETWLEEKLTFYLKDPQVSINLSGLRPAIIYVFGAVNRPGTYQFVREKFNQNYANTPTSEKTEITITNVLQKAGGILYNADITNISVVHAITEKEETYDLMALLKEGAGDDIILMPGDKIVVPEREQPMDPATFRLVSRSNYFQDKFPVLVLGSVREQGAVQIDPNNNSVNAAIAMAGGFSSLRQSNKIFVQRPTNNNGFSNIELNRKKVNMELLPGDIIFVAERKQDKFNRVLDSINRLGSLYFYSTQGTNNLERILKDSQ